MVHKILKDWSLFEKTLLFGSIIVISLVAFIFKSDLLTTICSIEGTITALLIAKGKNISQIFGVIITILYSIVSFRNKFYGEVIIYMFIMLPLFILGIISWFKHQSKETNTVEVNKISKIEWIIISIISIFVFIGIYFLLKAFNTSELIVSSISVVTSIFAIYLQIRRSRYIFYFYILNDIVLMVLWGIPIIGGNFLILPMILNPIINFINDCYGVYNWKRLELKQNKNRR